MRTLAKGLAPRASGSNAIRPGAGRDARRDAPPRGMSETEGGAEAETSARPWAGRRYRASRSRTRWAEPRPVRRLADGGNIIPGQAEQCRSRRGDGRRGEDLGRRRNRKPLAAAEFSNPRLPLPQSTPRHRASAASARRLMPAAVEGAAAWMEAEPAWRHRRATVALALEAYALPPSFRIGRPVSPTRAPARGVPWSGEDPASRARSRPRGQEHDHTSSATWRRRRDDG